MTTLYITMALHTITMATLSITMTFKSHNMFFFPFLPQRLASGLQLLMQYICAYVQLGGILEKPADMTQEKKEFGAFWGGTESVGGSSYVIIMIHTVHSINRCPQLLALVHELVVHLSPT